jgi:hypothetical protein
MTSLKKLRSRRDVMTLVPDNPATGADDSYLPHFVDPSTGTGDDAAWLNTYLAGLPYGVTVYFPNTTYQVASATVVLPDGNRYIGYGSGQGAGQTIFERQPGATLSAGGAILCDRAWMSSSTTPGVGESLHIEGLTIDGNVSSDRATVGHGLVVLSFRTKIVGNNVRNTPQAGIVLADQTAAGNDLYHTSAVENRVLDNTVGNTGSYGIWVQDHGTKALTDGYMIDNVIQSPGDQAIRNERSAGWFYRGNRAINCPVDGFYFALVYATSVIGNRVEGFGTSGAASATYCGFNFFSILGEVPDKFQGHPLTCIGNQAWTDESVGKSSTSYLYYQLRISATSEFAYVAFAGNAAHAEGGVSQPGSYAAVYALNGGTLVVQDQGNILDGPRPFRQVESGTLVHGGGSACFRADPVVAPSATANTFGASSAYGSFEVPLVLAGYYLLAGGTFQSETLTVQLQVTMTDGTSRSVSHGFTSPTGYESNTTNMAALIADNGKIARIEARVMSTIANSKANCQVQLFGWYRG